MFVDKSQDLDVMVPRRTLEEDQSGEEEETEDKPAGALAAASPAAPSSTTTAAAAAAVNVILNNVAPTGPPPLPTAVASGKPIIVKDTNSSNATPKATTISSSTKKVQLAPGGSSSTMSSSKTQSNVLMGRIDAHTDVSNRTTFTGSDVPQYGVLTDHQAELEKVEPIIDIKHILTIVCHLILMIQVLGNVNASWGIDVFRVRDLVFENRALTCITYRIFQVKLYSYLY